MSLAPYSMDRDATPPLHLGAQSPTPVTQGMRRLQVAQEEHVSQMVTGQGVTQHVHVSVIRMVII